MAVRSFGGKIPRIGEGSYVHPSADVFGDVTIGRGCWIGPGARLRGDYGTSVVGDYSSNTPVLMRPPTLAPACAAIVVGDHRPRLCDPHRHSAGLCCGRDGQHRQPVAQ